MTDYHYFRADSLSTTIELFPKEFCGKENIHSFQHEISYQFVFVWDDTLNTGTGIDAIHPGVCMRRLAILVW